MKNKLVIGNLLDQQKNKKGWLVGQFMDEPFRDETVEIYYKTFPSGDPGDKLHKHPIGTEYLMVLQGKARFRLGDEIFEIKKGDYFAIPSDTPDQLVEVLEELTIIGVRNPSVPNNKVFLGN